MEGRDGGGAQMWREGMEGVHRCGGKGRRGDTGVEGRDGGGCQVWREEIEGALRCGGGKEGLW